jgi:hypothetical protein
MPVSAPLARFFSLCALALLAATLVSCALKKNGAPRTSAAEPKASPTPSATPTPAPTPEARYVARVSVEGGETTERVLSPGSQSAPSATPTPAPAASPSPTPKPKSPNPFAALWQKVFPPKPTATPTPQMVFRVSTADGSQTEIPSGFGGAQPPPAAPSPTPILLKPRPTENFVMRAWHRIFPKKAAPPAAAPPQWIGVVKLVNEHDGYALVDAQNYAALPPGETLNAVGEDRETGVLRVTADRQAPFFIADIVSGKPRAGDRVYSPKP